MSKARLRNVASNARQWVEDGRAQALEVLVARRGGIVLHESFGRLTPEAKSPPAPLNALYPLASITKVLTATALMVLVEQGRVGLNRPVVDYVPEFKGEGKEGVLVRHLLTHTSGLREEETEKYALEQRGKTVTPLSDKTLHPLMHEYYMQRYGAPLWKAPGTEMSYVDFNFELAGEIVRRVAGMGLDAFAKSRIFRPLGMSDTHYCKVDAEAGRRIRRPPDPVDPQNPPDPLTTALLKTMETERLYSGSSLALSTAVNMARLGQMFLNGGAYGTARVLSPVTVAEMTRNQIPGIGANFLEQVFPEASWGLGWSIHGGKTGLCGGLYSSRSFEHWGAGGTYLWVDPELEIIGVYFSSTVSTPHPSEGGKYWSNDLFTDAVTAAVDNS
jgi:CubicO group peptidase (beta-lactamase class C family)